MDQDVLIRSLRRLNAICFIKLIINQAVNFEMTQLPILGYHSYFEYFSSEGCKGLVFLKVLYIQDIPISILPCQSPSGWRKFHCASVMKNIALHVFFKTICVLASSRSLFDILFF
jgi:hypothetical protein